VIGNGKSVLVWKDDWHSNGLLCDQFPRLFSFALNEDVSVADMVNTRDIITMFTLPLSAQAFQELQHLRSYLVGLISDPDSNDSRIFPWGSSTYASAKFYNFIFEQAPKDPMLQSIWKSKSLPKLSIFLALDQGSVEYERPDASQALEYLG
jgi:hypothetical protein